MVRSCCRLCFEEKYRPIGIFTAKGIKLRIPELIKKHFPDEIDENDSFPKFVCADCWTKLSDFHEFYIAVDEAKSTYLKNRVKAEEPDFIEIHCDPVKFEEFIPEYHDTIDEKADSVIPESSTVDNKPQVDLEKIDNDSNDNFESEDFANDETFNESEEDDFDQKFGESSYEKLDSQCKEKDPDVTPAATTATELAKEISECAEKKRVRNSFDDLVSKYMNMHCEICRHPLETLPEARQHYRSKHNQRSFNIKCCDRLLPASHIRDHLRYHMNPDIFKCKVCDKRFLISSRLKSHLQQKHSPRDFECDICKKKFGTLGNIRVHMQSVHSNVKGQYACHVCPKRFNTNSGLSQHRRNVHERIGEVVCHICAKVYGSKVSLRRHLLDHNDVPPPRVTCEVCGSTFKSEQNCIRHTKRHLEKAVACPHCHKMSPNRNALKSHIISVHSEPMLECHLCDKKFKRTLALTEHIATHTGEDLYSCKYCPQRFKYHSSLYLHYRGVHPVEWNVDRTSKTGLRKKAEKLWHQNLSSGDSGEQNYYN